jgi:hypothetical protein
MASQIILPCALSRCSSAWHFPPFHLPFSVLLDDRIQQLCGGVSNVWWPSSTMAILPCVFDKWSQRPPAWKSGLKIRQWWCLWASSTFLEALSWGAHSASTLVILWVKIYELALTVQSTAVEVSFWGVRPSPLHWWWRTCWLWNVHHHEAKRWLVKFLEDDVWGRCSSLILCFKVSC